MAREAKVSKRAATFFHCCRPLLSTLVFNLGGGTDAFSWKQRKAHGEEYPSVVDDKQQRRQKTVNNKGRKVQTAKKTGHKNKTKSNKQQTREKRGIGESHPSVEADF